jgi:hypothetical protein
LLGRCRGSTKSAGTEGRRTQQAGHAATSTSARPSCLFSSPLFSPLPPGEGSGVRVKDLNTSRGFS